MTTNLLGRGVTIAGISSVRTFDDQSKPYAHHLIHGEIVAVYGGPYREYEICVGEPKKVATITLGVLLNTFDARRVVEVPIEFCRIYQTPAEAKSATEYN